MVQDRNPTVSKSTIKRAESFGVREEGESLDVARVEVERYARAKNEKTQ